MPVPAVIAAAVPVLKAAGAWVGTHLGVKGLQKFGPKLVEGAKGLGGTIAGGLGKFGGGIAKAAKGYGAGVANSFNAAGGGIKGLFAGGLKAITSPVTSLWGGLGAMSDKGGAVGMAGKAGKFAVGTAGATMALDGAVKGVDGVGNVIDKVTAGKIPAEAGVQGPGGEMLEPGTIVLSDSEASGLDYESQAQPAMVAEDPLASLPVGVRRTMEKAQGREGFVYDPKALELGDLDETTGMELADGAVQVDRQGRAVAHAGYEREG